MKLSNPIHQGLYKFPINLMTTKWICKQIFWDRLSNIHFWPLQKCLQISWTIVQVLQAARTWEIFMFGSNVFEFPSGCYYCYHVKGRFMSWEIVKWICIHIKIHMSSYILLRWYEYICISTCVAIWHNVLCGIKKRCDSIAKTGDNHRFETFYFFKGQHCNNPLFALRGPSSGIKACDDKNGLWWFGKQMMACIKAVDWNFTGIFRFAL